MRLIQTFKPFSTRTDSFKIPNKNFVLFNIVEKPHTSILPILDDIGAHGQFAIFIPRSVGNLNVASYINKIMKYKQQVNKPIYFNESFFKSKRSCVIDASVLFQKLEIPYS